MSSERRAGGGAAPAVLVALVAAAAMLGPAGTASAAPAAAGSGTGSATAGSVGGGSATAGGPVVVQPPIEAGTPTVSAAASPSVVRLGAPFTLFVTVTFDAGVEVNLREPVDLGPELEVRHREVADRASPDGRRVREYQLQVIAWEVGDLAAPPIAVTFTLAGHAGQVETAPTPIRVDSVLGAIVDDPRPRPDAPPLSLSRRDWVLVWVAAAAAACLAAGIVLVTARRRRRQRLVPAPAGWSGGQVRLDTPAERALARLAAIERGGLLDRDEARRLGFGAMAETMRDYLGARYAAATPELTSHELVRALAASGVPPVEVGHIEAWLADCDIVKYGGLRSTAGEAAAVLRAARELVVATTAPREGAAAPGAETAAKSMGAGTGSGTSTRRERRES